MGFKFNPLDSALDLVGTSGGGPSGPATRYVAAFNNTSDWTLSAPDYVISILAATHGQGTNPNVQVFELVSGSYELVFPTIVRNPSGDITVSVSQSPDNRFSGVVLIL